MSLARRLSVAEQRTLARLTRRIPVPVCGQIVAGEQLSEIDITLYGPELAEVTRRADAKADS